MFSSARGAKAPRRGDAFEGVAAYNILRAQGKPVDVYVDALAASSASIIAMAGDTITMGPNCIMMVHNAWSVSKGYAADMRKMADVLDTVSAAIGETYVSRTGLSVSRVKALMDACREKSLEKDHNQSDNGYGRTIAQLTLLRDRAGDRSALDEYASWVKQIVPKSVEHSAADSLKPLWTYPDRPSIDAATKAMFTDPKSPWLPLVSREQSRHYSTFEDPISSPLIALPWFREAVLEYMANHQEFCGSPTELLKVLAKAAEGDGQAGGGLPRSASILIRQLHLLRVNLDQFGLEIESGRTKRGRKIEIRKVKATISGSKRLAEATEAGDDMPPEVPSPTSGPGQALPAGGDGGDGILPTVPPPADASR